IKPNGTTATSPAGVPPLPGGHWSHRRPGRATITVGSSQLRLLSVTYRGGLLVAVESLSELSHVESVLDRTELGSAPLLMIVVFVASLLIGLRSAAPIELARRRQLEFTSDASHELRTPLSVIEAELALAAGHPHRLGAPTVAGTNAETGSVAGGGGEPESPAAVAAELRATSPSLVHIARETQRLRRIVDDLLWLARLDSLPPTPGPDRIDVVTIAQACVERFGTVAAARTLSLSFDRLGAGDATIVAPAEWVDRLAGALVDNACKYAQEGGSVRVRAGNVGTKVVLAVDDTGPGLPSEMGDRVFDRFRRGATKEAGHGLGLAIADSVVRSTGGRWRRGNSPDLGGAHMQVEWPKR
ncbi:MAG TPA: HAMP domain-containing sensor histidine kinase, partial [Acidimicrobiales bacterium]|nr:HAMP domain-containing sensor histidine kinase [Acidimicrobiales bacterium]